MLRRRHRARIHHERHAELPYGVRVFAWVRAIRWVGWGLGEALLPVFIIMFSSTFAEAGLFSSTVDIASLVSLPLIGAWADRMPARTLVLASLIIYPFVGLSYFFAGLFGLALFILIARFINGFNWELENVGIETYYRRITSRRKIAASFGYIDAMSHAAWIGAALVGMFLVRFMPIHYLLLGIAPFAIIAYFVALKAPKDAVRAPVQPPQRPQFFASYGKAFSELRTWNSRLWLLGVLVLFAEIISTLIYFFVPIDAYLSGANLPMVVLITVFGSAPALFGYKLGRITDRHNKYAVITTGLVIVAAVSVGLALIPAYWFKLLAMFLLGIILELFYVAQGSLITTLGPEETYGERGSAFESILVLGDLVAPLLLGVMLDIIGFANLSFVVAGAALVLGIVYRLSAGRHGFKRRHGAG